MGLGNAADRRNITCNTTVLHENISLHKEQDNENTD
jgi:hypothetical protein